MSWLLLLEVQIDSNADIIYSISLLCWLLYVGCRMWMVPEVRDISRGAGFEDEKLKLVSEGCDSVMVSIHWSTWTVCHFHLNVVTVLTLGCFFPLLLFFVSLEECKAWASRNSWRGFKDSSRYTVSYCVGFIYFACNEVGGRLICWIMQNAEHWIKQSLIWRWNWLLQGPHRSLLLMVLPCQTT